MLKLYKDNLKIWMALPDSLFPTPVFGGLVSISFKTTQVLLIKYMKKSMDSGKVFFSKMNQMKLSLILHNIMVKDKLAHKKRPRWFCSLNHILKAVGLSSEWLHFNSNGDVRNSPEKVVCMIHPLFLLLCCREVKLKPTPSCHLTRGDVQGLLYIPFFLNSQPHNLSGQGASVGTSRLCPLHSALC